MRQKHWQKGRGVLQVWILSHLCLTVPNHSYTSRGFRLIISDWTMTNPRIRRHTYLLYKLIAEVDFGLGYVCNSCICAACVFFCNKENKLRSSQKLSFRKALKKHVHCALVESYINFYKTCYCTFINDVPGLAFWLGACCASSWCRLAFSASRVNNHSFRWSLDPLQCGAALIPCSDARWEWRHYLDLPVISNFQNRTSH